MSDCCSAPQGAYDLVVVGAGSAGFSAAITAAEEGARVALIGYGTIGGTCVNVGCVPSKALIRAVEPLHQARATARFDGIAATAWPADWAAIVRQKQRLVEELRAAKYSDVLPGHYRITYLEGSAHLTAEGTLAVDGQAISAPKVILATGSRPAVPEIPGIETVEALDSTSALELESLPRSLLVMGGGYVGCELAQLFARAGVLVTVVSRRGLLPKAEPEVSEALTRVFEAENINVVSSLAYEHVEQLSDGVRLRVRTADGALDVDADRLLLATGSQANTEGLDLPRAGIDTAPGGGIRTDDRMRTSRVGIYAAGDVTGQDQFVYMAAYGAKLAARNALNGDSLRYDASTMPTVVFTDPQVASVGLTEAQASAAGYNVRTSVLDLAHVPRALAARDTRGLIKLVGEAGSKRLLGAHVIAPEGADSIQTAIMALKAGMTWEELGDTIFPYLTTVEGLKLAAQTFEKDVAQLSCCAG
ncbi:mercury(II) reductase [Roseivivax marinus]|uniref:mercury(II) reductase n=1 Tax=Roseivivax marinus TaxID=1379903 RepID=UPI00273F6B4A|nr:mercury(II) reductase [Roseivivax marinus]